MRHWRGCSTDTRGTRDDAIEGRAFRRVLRSEKGTTIEEGKCYEKLFSLHKDIRIRCNDLEQLILHQKVRLRLVEKGRP
jgi:hypothetical protein